MRTSATIKDIARKASVGVSTVSRALNNHPDVSAETREKVMKVVGELSYRPHSGARQLVTDTTDTICFVMSNRDVLNPFHSHVLIGVEQYARRVSHNVIFMRLDYSPDIPPDKFELPRVIWERGTVDGLLLAGTNHPNFIKTVKALGIPFVLFGNNVVGRVALDDMDTVWFDSEGGTRQATEYLIELGHRHIWFLADLNVPWYQRCYKGFVKTMQKHGLKPRTLDGSLGLSPFDVGYAAAGQIADLRHRITAVVSGDDNIALGAMSGVTQRGLSIPKDVSIVGFDDIDEIKYFQPALTTVRVPKERIGEEMAKRLFERLENRSLPPARYVVPTELVVRQSSAEPHKSATRAAGTDAEQARQEKKQ